MFKNTLVVTVFLILSGLLGFFAQIIFASSFGASAEMDVYFKVLSVPAILTGISPIIFSSVLIPSLAKFKSDKEELKKFIDSMWMLVLFFGILFSLVGFFIMLKFIDFFIPENTIYFRNIGIQVSLLVWIGSGFILMSGYLSAVLNYNKKFFKVAWTSLLPASFMIAIVLLFDEILGVRSIALGFCIALTIQFLIFLKASKVTFSFFKFNLNDIPFKRLLLGQSFLVTLSLLPFTVLVPIAYFWASKLEIGSVSYLGYSQNFSGFLSVAVSMGISIVSFPELADKFANDEGRSSLKKFEKSLRYVLLFAMFAVGVLIALRIPILTIFYQRGSFDVEAVNNLSSVLPWYLLAAIFVGGLNLLRTLFYSRGKFKEIALLGLIIPIIFFVISGILKENFSFVGIGIANTLTFAILFFMTVYLAKNKDLEFLTKNFYFFIIKNFISVLFAGLIVTLFLSLISDIAPLLVSIILSLFLFLVIYLFSSRFIFKLSEIEEIISIVMNKLRSSKYS